MPTINEIYDSIGDLFEDQFDEPDCIIKYVIDLARDTEFDENKFIDNFIQFFANDIENDDLEYIINSAIIALNDLILPNRDILYPSKIKITIDDKMNYEQLLNLDDFKDITIKCIDGDIKAHKIILSWRSEYFNKIFSKEWTKEIKNEISFEYKKNIVFMCIHYLYTGVFYLPNDVHDFLKIMQFFDMLTMHNHVKMIQHKIIELYDNINVYSILKYAQIIRAIETLDNNILFENFYRILTDLLIKNMKLFKKTFKYYDKKCLDIIITDLNNASDIISNILS